jgi:two-component system, cell cycle sensor histidine kinase PleC
MERRPTILIVDDHRDNIDLLAQFLRASDYSMSFASSGIEAIESVRRNPPSLILLDVMMPDMNGHEVTRRIKDDPDLPFIPIILVTAKHDLADKVQGLDAGADDYLSKPIQSGELLAKVRAFLRLKQSQDALMAERNKIDVLYRIQQQVTSSLDVDQVVRDTIITMVEVLDATQGSVIVSDHDGDVWRKILARRNRDEREESFVTRKIIEEGLAGVAIRTGTPQILDDTATDDRWIRLDEDRGHVRSALAVPLIHHDEVLGVLTLAHPEPRHFRADQLPVVTAAAGQISVALNNARLYGKLKDAEKSREQFLHMLTHDLRGPLAGISGCLHVLSMSPHGDEHTLFIDMARAACKTQEQLIDDILDVYKADAGLMELDFAEVNMREVGDEVMQNLTGAAAEHYLTLKMDLPDEPKVNGDRNKLIRVLTNLVGNSLKFTRKGGVYITAEPAEDERMLLVKVRDTGLGIPAGDLEHIFDRFYQAPQRGGRRGTGLGLAFCREVVNAHGGRIWADSILGNGTTISMALPIAGEAV